MKMRFKAASSLMIVVMMVALSGVSALAATYTYSTIYTKNSAGNVGVKVTATAANVAVGEQVTYYAKNGDKVVYIDQEETGGDGTVNFEYITEDVSSLTQSFGGTSVEVAQPVGETTGETVDVTIHIYTADGTEVFGQPIPVMAQENLTESDHAPRTFNIPGLGDISDIEFWAEGDEFPTTVDLGQCVYVGGKLTIYPAVFKSNGTLLIHSDYEATTPVVYLGDIIDNSTDSLLDYVTLGRALGLKSHEGYEIGICVSSTNEFADPVAITAATAESQTVLYPATQIGADGSFAISLQDEDPTAHFCEDRYVTTYFKNADGEITFAKKAGSTNYKQFGLDWFNF